MWTTNKYASMLLESITFKKKKNTSGHTTGVDIL